MIAPGFVDTLTARADIVQVVGEHVELRKAGADHKGLCPFHGERSPSFFVSPARQTYHCFGCGAHGDALAFIMERAGASFVEAVHHLAGVVGLAVPDEGGPPPPRVTLQDSLPRIPRHRAAAPAQHEGLSEFWRELWRAAAPLAGTVGEQYLLARSCVIPPRDGHLRFHPALRHPPSGTAWPALVALITDAVTGAPMSVHRTYIQADGAKAPVQPARMLAAGHAKAGGVIRLWPDEAVTAGLGIAEGIETALSLAHAFKPVWSCIDAGNLAAFPVLDGVESLTIAVDHDPAGIAAARACADRCTAAGREVRMAMCDGAKTDLNDLARAT